MRDIIVFAVVFGLAPLALKKPAIGIFLYAWLSLMNPHRLTYGAAYAFPFAAIVAFVTIIGVVISKEKIKVEINSLILLILTLFSWVSFTSFFALEPALAWDIWDKVAKTFLMVLLTMSLINTKKDIQLFALVIAGSLAFFGFKGGIFTILSAGAYRVHGPAGSYIADNNDLALALLIAAPLIWLQYLAAKDSLIRFMWALAVFLTIIAAVGTYSRGALLAGLAMLFFLWIKSTHKINTMLLLAIVGLFVIIFMPEQWFERMASIDDYKSDSSALGRINAWLFAIEVATHNWLGGGFNVFTANQFAVYAPNPLDVHAAHSIYFRVLGEHGWIGLFLFVSLIFASWRSATRIIKLAEGNTNLDWAKKIAAMSQVSIVGYCVGGAFLSLSYYDYFYYVIALIYCTGKIVRRETAPEKTKIRTIALTGDAT